MHHHSRSCKFKWRIWIRAKTYWRKKFGFKLTGNSMHKWLINKENKEHQYTDYIVLPSYLAKKHLLIEVLANQN